MPLQEGVYIIRCFWVIIPNNIHTCFSQLPDTDHSRQLACYSERFYKNDNEIPVNKSPWRARLPGWFTWLLGFYRGGAETWVPVVLGIMALIYSLVTDYELGAVKMLSMKTHLALDLLSGIALAISPWIFNFDDFVYLPHLVLGIFEVIAALVTRQTPPYVSAGTSTRVRKVK